MTPSSVLRSRYDTVIRDVTAGNSRFRLLGVRDTNVLVDAIDPETFAVDERFPYWADLWVSAVALAEALPEHLAGMHVLELGCGLGLAGIAAARAGAEVVMTDYEPDALMFAAENVALNLEPVQQSRVTFATMDWRTAVPDRRFDLVIGSDILYERRFFAPLLGLLDRSVAPAGSILLAEPDRAVGQDFLTLARSTGWSVSTARRSSVWHGVPVTVTLNTLRPAPAGNGA